MAVAELKDLWNALTSTDYCGTVSKLIKDAEAKGDPTFRRALEKGVDFKGVDNSVADVTGAEFQEPKYPGRPQMTAEPRFKMRGILALNALGFAGDVYTEGWQDATFDMMDVTGQGRQWLGQAQWNHDHPA